MDTFSNMHFLLNMGINSIAPLAYPEGKYVIPKPAGPRGDSGVEKPSSFRVQKTLPRSEGPVYVAKEGFKACCKAERQKL